MSRMLDHGFHLGRQLLLLLGFFLVGIFIATAIGSLSASFLGAGSRDTLLVQSVAQNLFAFMIPAWGCMRMESTHAFSMLGFDRGYTLKALSGLFAAWVIGVAALNQIIYWNAEMHLPDFLGGLEESWRKMEEINTTFTDTLTGDASWWGLLSGILVVGIITGLAEEMFFRGGLQGALIQNSVPPHAAIWITAIVFSLMHFQMFGFVPRLLLGAWFGYLYWWSGSLWLSATAHAFNNSLVVLFTWLEKRGAASGAIDMAGVDESGFPYLAVGSALLFAIFLIYCRNWFSPKQTISNGQDDCSHS